MRSRTFILFAAGLVPVFTAADTVGADLYVRTTELQCESTLVRISSVCEMNSGDSHAFCLLQKTDFVDAKSMRRSGIHLYNNSAYAKDLTVAVSATCVQIGAGDAVILTYSNFGGGRECYSCEWEQLIDTSGQVIGSSFRRGDTAERAKRRAAEYRRTLETLGARPTGASTKIERFPGN